jgi:hypothetical protein
MRELINAPEKCLLDEEFDCDYDKIFVDKESECKCDETTCPRLRKRKLLSKRKVVPVGYSFETGV